MYLLAPEDRYFLTGPIFKVSGQTGLEFLLEQKSAFLSTKKNIPGDWIPGIKPSLWPIRGTSYRVIYGARFMQIYCLKFGPFRLRIFEQ